MQADIAEVVAEVDRELEQLSQGPAQRRRRRAQERELETTVSGWMAD
jgi:hypothetical protein